MGNDDTKFQIAPGIRSQLVEYFESESDLGMRSSFGVLVDAALGGWSSNGDHERSVVRKYEVGRPATPVTRSRATRALLLAIGSQHETVLDALYGMHDYRHSIDRAFVSGDGDIAWDVLREFVGVALLTDALRAGFERDCDKKPSASELHGERHYVPPTVVRVVRPDDDTGWPEEHFELRYQNDKSRRLNTLGGYLITLCKHHRTDKQLERIKNEAAQLARGAVSAFADALGVQPFVLSEHKEKKARERIPIGHVERVRAEPGRWS